MRRLSALLGVAAITLVALSAIANAQERVGIGYLNCHFLSSDGLNSIMSCVTFTGGDNPQKDFYYVQTPKSDRDLGINRINREAAMAWMVFGPSHQTRRGELYGDYGGVHGSATVRGGQALVGGSENSFALRPLDAVAARVAELKLVEGR